jgi:hypothetical protein
LPGELASVHQKLASLESWQVISESACGGNDTYAFPGLKTSTAAVTAANH